MIFLRAGARVLSKHDSILAPKKGRGKEYISEKLTTRRLTKIHSVIELQHAHAASPVLG